MKRSVNWLILLTLLISYTSKTQAQNISEGINAITSSDLESYVSFLSSPLLNGRMNGEPGLEIAQQFIASQAKLLGLKPAAGTSYFQPYNIIKKSIDTEESVISIIHEKNDTTTIKLPFHQILPAGPSDFEVDGEVVFAGYGLKLDKYGYDDFENVKTEGKILLVMTGSPSSDDGTKFIFEGFNQSFEMSIQVKITALMFTSAEAVLFVPDPKSGFSSMEEQFPGISDEMNSSMSLKGDKNRTYEFPGIPKIVFVNRLVADELLKESGYSLEDLQKKIDTDIKPHSFIIPYKKLIISETSVSEEKTLYNVAAFVEGSDPVLKNEYVVISGHVDHIGGSGERINTGADDDASGCAALLSMAEAFQNLGKKPLRSILFLWVSGEEIGLYGSRYYVRNPLVPLEKTIADLNMDMIGRVKGVADTAENNPMTGPSGVFVITGNQSKELIAIADEVDRGTILDLDYSLSGKNHPLQLFARSDHYNFVKKDIPVLFFTTGLHADYHTPGDVIEKIDFNKMEEITKTMFRIGYAVANRKTRIVVDNPFSKW